MKTRSITCSLFYNNVTKSPSIAIHKFFRVWAVRWTFTNDMQAQPIPSKMFLAQTTLDLHKKNYAYAFFKLFLLSKPSLIKSKIKIQFCDLFHAVLFSIKFQLYMKLFLAETISVTGKFRLPIGRLTQSTNRR